MNDSTKAAGGGVSRFYVPLGLLVLGLFGVRTISHADFWTHLVTGRWIAANGIPRLDNLSLIQPQGPWVDATWLYDRLLYALWSLGAAPLVTLLNAGLMVLAFVLLLRLARRWSGPAAQLLALVVCALLLAPNFVVGPRVLGLFFAALFIRRLAAGRPGPATWAVLLLAQVLWTNLHGSFLLGPLIALVFAIERVQQTKSKIPDTTGSAGDTGAAGPPTWRAGLLLALAVLAVTLVNPYGLRLHRQLLETGFNITGLTEEWISPFSGEFDSVLGRYVIYLAWLLCALGLIAEKRRLPLGLSLLALLGSLLVVRSIFFLDCFAVLSFPFLALSIETTGVMFRNNFSELLDRQTGGVHRWNALLVVLLPLLAIGSVLSNHYFYTTGSASVFGLGVNEEMFPAAAVPVIVRSDFPLRICNDVPEGGYLRWRCPQRRVLVDGRAGLYSADVIARVKGAFNGHLPDWAALEEEMKPSAALLNCVRPGVEKLAQHLIGGVRWRLAYVDGTSALLLRTIPDNKALLADQQIKTSGLQHLNKAYCAYEERVARQLFPAHSPAMISAGSFFMALGNLYQTIGNQEEARRNYALADSFYTLLAKGAPRMATVWLNLGICKLELGQTSAALPCLRRATQRNAGNARAWLYLGRACAQAQLVQEAKEANERAAKLNSVLAASFLKSPAAAVEQPAEK